MMFLYQRIYKQVIELLLSLLLLYIHTSFIIGPELLACTLIKNINVMNNQTTIVAFFSRTKYTAVHFFFFL